MSDFRRWILAFAMLVLVLGFVAPANAQLSCTAAAAVVPTLRHEGFTELTGDILLTCTAASGAVPLATGHIVPTANISVSLSAPITSRVLGGTNPQYLTEALLVVNDPAPADQVVCLFPTNPAVACQMYAGTPSFNVFQGLGCVSTATINCAPAANTVTFQGIPADPPVTTRTYRITNIRIDATGVPLGTGGGGTTPVNAYVSVSPSSSISVSNPQPLVGVVGWGLVNTQPTSTGATLYQCENFSGKLGQVIFTENFATAFKTQGAVTTAPTAYPQNTPGVPYNTESGLEIAVSNGAGKTAEAGAAAVKTLQNWEQDGRHPSGPVAALLRIIAYEPHLAMKAIHRT